MSVATSAVERLQDVAVKAGAITTADERATAADLKVPLAAVHGAATFYDDLARTRRGSRQIRVCEGTACFAADGGQHVGDVERVLGVSAGSCREDGVEGSDLPGMHHRFAAALATAYEMITDTNRSAREAGRIDVMPRWPMIILRSPKGWTGPAEVDGTQVVAPGDHIKCRWPAYAKTKIICGCWRSGCAHTGPRSCSTPRARRSSSSETPGGSGPATPDPSR